MKIVAGVFKSLEQASEAIRALRAAGIPDQHLNLITPGDEIKVPDDVPTTEAEAPGMGSAVGALVGGVSGAALGPVFLGLAVAGLGPVSAVGAYAALLMGAGGAVAGGVAGGALEKGLSQGLPRDEVFVYEDALRQGRSVVIVITESDDQASIARGELTHAGAESIDAARRQWWLGLRDAEEAHYRGSEGKDFGGDEEEAYRLGFEAAQDREFRGKPYEEAATLLRRKYPGMHDEMCFRMGYLRGQEYREQLCREPSPRS